MELEEIIDEIIYQEVKCNMKKKSDYWTSKEIEEMLKYNKKIKEYMYSHF